MSVSYVFVCFIVFHGLNVNFRQLFHRFFYAERSPSSSKKSLLGNSNFEESDSRQLESWTAFPKWIEPQLLIQLPKAIPLLPQKKTPKTPLCTQATAAASLPNAPAAARLFARPSGPRTRRNRSRPKRRLWGRRRPRWSAPSWRWLHPLAGRPKRYRCVRSVGPLREKRSGLKRRSLRRPPSFLEF